MSRTEEITVKMASLGGASLAYTLELSEHAAELRISAGSGKLQLARGVNSVRQAVADLRETADRLEDAINRVHPPVQHVEATMLPSPHDDEDA